MPPNAPLSKDLATFPSSPRPPDQHAGTVGLTSVTSSLRGPELEDENRFDSRLRGLNGTRHSICSVYTVAPRAAFLVAFTRLIGHTPPPPDDSEISNDPSTSRGFSPLDRPTAGTRRPRPRQTSDGQWCRQRQRCWAGCCLQQPALMRRRPKCRSTLTLPVSTAVPCLATQT